MTAPILIRRRRPPAPGDDSFRARLRSQWAWSWFCHIPGCDDTAPATCGFGLKPTHAAALKAGLAHLAEHATADAPAPRTPLRLDRWAPPPCA